jgi:hypothetical protein
MIQPATPAPLLASRWLLNCQDSAPTAEAHSSQSPRLTTFAMPATSATPTALPSAAPLIWPAHSPAIPTLPAA